jgi:hypothetical protein
LFHCAGTDQRGNIGRKTNKEVEGADYGFSFGKLLVSTIIPKTICSSSVNKLLCYNEEHDSCCALEESINGNRATNSSKEYKNGSCDFAFMMRVHYRRAENGLRRVDVVLATASASDDAGTNDPSRSYNSRLQLHERRNLLS